MNLKIRIVKANYFKVYVFLENLIASIIFHLLYNFPFILGMIANSLWLIQRALPVILLSALPHLTQCNTLNYEVDGYPDIRMLEPRVQRAPFNSWAGKRFGGGGYDMSHADFGKLDGLEQFYLSHLAGARSDSPISTAKRAPFNSWAGKRAPFNSWAGKRAPFNSWAGKRAPFNSWAGKRSSEELNDSNLLFNHGDARFGDAESRYTIFIN